MTGAAGPVGVRANGFGWRHGGRRAWALRELSFAIEPGERILLLGPSGGGKSTLLAALAGLGGDDQDAEQEGELLLDGVAAARARGRAGLVLQDPESQVIMARVGDDVAFGAENLGVPADEIRRRIPEALRAVGLALPLDHLTHRLSGGQKQRLALAAAFAMRPGLLLLDEPTANLDPAGAAEVRTAVGGLVADRARTLVVVEHRVAEWLPLVDRILALDGEGGLLADGDPETVLARHGAALAAAGIRLPGRLELPHWSTPARGAELLRTEGLGVGRDRETVLGGLDLVARSGGALALTGVNGAGKTTTALTLSGLLPARAGRVLAADGLRRGAGEDPLRWRPRQLLTRIGHVFQNPEHQFLARTVRDELSVGPRALRQPPAEREARVGELLERTRLAPLAAANPFTLSGGQKRRLSVATALATSPSLLVLDEPTFGQDAVGWRELVLLLREILDDGRGIVTASHDEELLVALDAERVTLSTDDITDGVAEAVA